MQLTQPQYNWNPFHPVHQYHNNTKWVHKPLRRPHWWAYFHRLFNAIRGHAGIHRMHNEIPRLPLWIVRCLKSINNNPHNPFHCGDLPVRWRLRPYRPFYCHGDDAWHNYTYWYKKDTPMRLPINDRHNSCRARRYQHLGDDAIEVPLAASSRRHILRPAHERIEMEGHWCRNCCVTLPFYSAYSHLLMCYNNYVLACSCNKKEEVCASLVVVGGARFLMYVTNVRQPM